MQSLFILVRSADERTASLSMKLLGEAFPDVKVNTISVSPFSLAIKQGFEMAIQHRSEWTLIIDADVLVSATGIKDLITRSGKVAKNIFLIQGLILDKFFSVYRPAGNHLYRTEFMPQAIDRIPAEGTSLRPETDMLNNMSKAGYPWIQCDAKIGIHDYEQHYAAIYRKCFLQAHKHQWLLPDLIPYWKKKAKDDTDYQVALWGVLSGKIYDGEVLVDKHFLQEEAEEILKLKGIQEKRSMEIVSPDFVQDVMRHDQDYPQQILQDKIFPTSKWNACFELSSKQTPPVSTSRRWLRKAGDYLIRLGNRLKKI